LSVPGWAEARAKLASPIFAPLAPALAKLPADRWPSPGELSAAAEGVATSRGVPVRFVAPRPRAEEARRNYELHVAETGEVETRPGSWHDVFNALAWIAFPKAKARINAQHVAILEEGGDEEARRRGPERDALTLFDEGGVIVASSAPELLRLIVEHDWKVLFWHRRAELEARMRFFAFGHALHEKALDPYLGIVAKAIFVPVDELFFMLPHEAQVERVDALAAAHFAERSRFRTPKAMAVLPVLGVPGWHRGTDRESFYDDPDYFRGRPGAREA
jgi:DUF3025 family protein